MENLSYERIKNLFIKYGYLPNEDLIWRTYIGVMQTLGRRKEGQDVYAFCLDGPAGTGKSSFAIVYSKVLEELTGEKIKFLKYTCNEKTGKEETFEDVNLVAAITHDAEKLIIPGFVAQAINECNKGNRVVLRLDEYDKAKPAEDSFLLEFLQEASMYSSQTGELKLKDPGKLQVILCKNDNRAQLSYPLTRRLNFIDLEYTTPGDMAEIIGMKMKEQDSAIKVLIVMMYSNLYKNKDDYTRIPSASEVMIAIDEADILTKGGASKQYIYKSIIKNLLKTKVDIQTFLTGNKKNGRLDSELEDLKTVFDNEAASSFDKKSLLVDLYEMFFKPIAEEYEAELRKSLDDICDETNEFRSKTDFRLKPIEVGAGQESKFDLCSDWFLLGEVTTFDNDAEVLVRKADAIKYDGPVFIIDDDYYITVVREVIDNDKVNLKFLCNKPAIPTGIVSKLKELIQYMSISEFEFSFPLVSNYPVSNYQKKQNGFYEYSTDYRSTSIDEVFEDIKEIKLASIKLGNGKIIEGKDVPIQNFGRGDKAIIKGNGNNIQLDLIKDNSPINEINSFFPINLKQPIVVSMGKKDRIGYNPDTNISTIKVKSKKKGGANVECFEPDFVAEELDRINSAAAEELNASLLSRYRGRAKHNIYANLDDSQKKFLSHFVDGEIDVFNINEAIENCVDYAIENDILNPNTRFVKPRNIYDCLDPDPKVYSLRLKQLNGGKNEN